MATVAEVEVIIKGRNEQLKRSMAESKREVDSFATGAERAGKKAESGIKLSLDGIAAKAKMTGAVLTASLTAPLIALGQQAVQSAIRMSNLERGMTTVSGSAKKAAIEIAKLKKIAEQPGLGFEEAVKGSIRLQAAGLSAKEAAAALSGFGNALATVGGTKAELDGVVTALTQISSKGKVSAEEINQLAERIPQIRQIMISAFGTADTEILQKAEITSKEFIKVILGEVKKLPQAAKGPGEDFEKAWEGALDALRELGKVILPSLTKFIREQVIPATEKLVNWLKSLSEEGKANILKIGILAAALGPGLGLAGVMVSTVKKGWELVKVIQAIGAASAGSNLAGILGGLGKFAAGGAGLVGALAYGTYAGGAAIADGSAYKGMTAVYNSQAGFRPMPVNGPTSGLQVDRSASGKFQGFGNGMPGFLQGGGSSPNQAAQSWDKYIAGQRATASKAKEAKKAVAEVDKETEALKGVLRGRVNAAMAGKGKGAKKGGGGGGDNWGGFMSSVGEALGGEAGDGSGVAAWVDQYAEAVGRVADALREVAIEKAKIGDPKGANEAKFMGLDYQDWKATRGTTQAASLLASKKGQAAPYVEGAMEAIRQLTGMGKAVAKEALALSDSYLSEAEIRANAYMESMRVIWVRLEEWIKAAKEKQQAALDSAHADLMAKEFEARLAKEEEQIQAHAERVKAISDGIAAGISNSIINAFGSIGRGWKGFLGGLLSGLQQMLADMGRQFIQSQVLKWVTTLVGGAFGGGGGGDNWQGIPFALPGKATGGPVLSNNAYMVGENGPELFVPNGSGRVVSPSGVNGGGGVVVNMTVNTPDAGSFRESMGQIQARLAQATSRAARRNG